MVKQTLLGILFLSISGFLFANEQGPLLQTPQGSDTVKYDSTSDTAMLNKTKSRVETTREFVSLFETNAAATKPDFLPVNPKVVAFVEDFTDKNQSELEEMKLWAKPMFDKMDKILDSYDIPKEMKYLAVIESKLRTAACSYAGAVGPWQFMPETGRLMGLKVSNKYDERKDLYKSTHAACKYLNRLFDIYKDWLLVIAAYNGGPGNINKAIKHSGSSDFWQLQHYLPAESRKHVKKFIATHYLMEGNGSICTVTKNEAADIAVLQIDSTVFQGTLLQNISGRYLAAIVIKHIDIDLNLFNKLNPLFDDKIANYGKYGLRLPEDKMYNFLVKKDSILFESMQAILNPQYTANRMK